MNTTIYPLKKQLKREIKIFRNQKNALSEPQSAHLRPDEKETLSAYFKSQIKKRKAQLAGFTTGPTATRRAVSMEVLEPEIV